MSKITQHSTGASPPSCLYDTLDNATAAYTAIHEWQESKKFDDPHKNVLVLDNNGQRVFHPHMKLPLSFTWRYPILKIKKTDSESPLPSPNTSVTLSLLPSLPCSRHPSLHTPTPILHTQPRDLLKLPPPAQPSHHFMPTLLCAPIFSHTISSPTPTHLFHTSPHQQNTK